MDVVRLNPDTHMPELLIEGYDSVIFTERYYGFGEFELKTSKVVETMTALPFYSLVSILTSRDIMVVETHEIEKDDHGVTTLTVTGRSYINILEIRTLYLPILGYHNPWPMKKLYPVTEALAVYIWNLICNNTGKDVIHGSGRPPINYMPNLGVSMIGDRDEAEQQWEVAEEEAAWSFVKDLLELGALSLRVVRPIPEAETFNIISVDMSGNITESSSTAKITRIEIYSGVDRSEDVVLREDAGHFVSSKYLFSRRDYRNITQVIHSGGRELVYYPSEAENDTTGFARRVMTTDGGTAGEDLQNFRRLMIQKGAADLARARPISIFDGKLSIDIPYVYGVDYALGDLLMAVADYGLYTKMQVTEYIHSYDRTGETAYPTLMPVGIPVILPEPDVCFTYFPPYAVGDAGEVFTVITIPNTIDGAVPFTVYVSIAESADNVWVRIVGEGYSNSKSAVWNGDRWVARFPDWSPSQTIGTLYATEEYSGDDFYTLTNVRVCPGVDAPGIVCVTYNPPYISPVPGWQDFPNAEIQPMMVYLTVEEDVDNVWLGWETPYSATNDGGEMVLVDGEWTKTIAFVLPGEPGDMIGIAPFDGPLYHSEPATMLTMTSLRVCHYTYDPPVTECVVYEDPWEDQPYIANQIVRVVMPADSVDVFATIGGYLGQTWTPSSESIQITAYGTWPNHYLARVYIELASPLSTLWVWTYHPDYPDDIREATGSGTSWYIDYPSWPGTSPWRYMFLMPTSSTGGSTYYTPSEVRTVPSLDAPETVYIRVVDPSFVDARHEASELGDEWTASFEYTNDIMFMNAEDVDQNVIIIESLRVCEG